MIWAAHHVEENTSGCQAATYLRVAAWGMAARTEHTDELISECDFCLSSTGVSLRKKRDFELCRKDMEFYK